MNCDLPYWFVIFWATALLASFIGSPTFGLWVVWELLAPDDIPEAIYAVLCGLCFGIVGVVLIDAVLRGIFAFAEGLAGCNP